MPPIPSPYRRGRVDLDAWRRRFRSRLTTRFGLRLHMTLVVALVFAAAFVTTRVMHGLGVHSMGVRYLVASLTGYAAFFGLLRAWLWYVTTEAGGELAPKGSPDDVAAAIDPDAPGRDDPETAEESAAAYHGSNGGLSNLAFVPDLSVGSGSSSGGSSGGSSAGGLDLGEGLVAVLVIAVVAIVAAVIFGAAGYLIYQAPAVLGEAAMEAVLASVLARSSRRVTTADWTGSVFSATWKPALAMLAVATLGGFALQSLCPGSSTLRGSIKICVQDRDKN